MILGNNAAIVLSRMAKIEHPRFSPNVKRLWGALPNRTRITLMKKTLPLIALFSGMLIPAVAAAYGEGSDIPYVSRAMHLLTNEVRADIPKAIDICGHYCREGKDCYPASLPAVYWDNNLFRAAQFHAEMSSKMTDTVFGCIQHNSPCQLADNFAADFPQTCDANPACACKDGKAQCGQSGTSSSVRVNAFGTRYSSENLVASTNPLPHQLFYLLFREDSTADPEGCGFTYNNGHRVNILREHNAVGIGFAGKIGVQDFGWIDDPAQPVSSGSHYADAENNLWFKLSYDAKTDAQTAYLAIGKSCRQLALSIGNGKRGIWSIAGDKTAKACTPYYYEVKDANGNITRYPTAGALLYDCENSWTDAPSDIADRCIQSDDSGNGGSAGDKDNNNNGKDENSSAEQGKDENSGTGQDNNNSGSGQNNNNSGTGQDGNNSGTEQNGNNSGTEQNGNNSGTEQNGNNAEADQNGDGANADKIDSCSATLYRPASSGLGAFLLFLFFGFALNRYRKQKIMQ